MSISERFRRTLASSIQPNRSYRVAYNRDIVNINAATLAIQHDPEPSWLKSAGIFKTDPQFQDFEREIQAYRDELDLLNSEYILPRLL